MPLKDLTTEKAKVTEQKLESILKDYVRWDPRGEEIILLPSSAHLRNTQRVLVYLLARKGWQFILTTKGPEEAVKPGHIEKGTGIPGGTLRPILKTLKEGKTVVCVSGRYMVPDHNIDAVGRDIATTPDRAPKARPRTGPRKAKQRGSGARRARPRLGPTHLVQELCRKGFFREGKTLKQVGVEMGRTGHPQKQTALSGIMQKLVQTEVLTRQKVETGGKDVYEYQIAKG